MGDWEYLPHAGVPGILADVSAEYREHVRSVIWDVVAGKLEEARLEHPMEPPDGPSSWVETRVWALRGSAGEVLSVRGHSRPLAARPGASGARDGASSLSVVREALERDGFELHAQPIVDLATGQRVQHELLLRLRDPGGALLRPANFLPEAEASGLVLAIDEWVAGQALELASLGHAVEFNVSARSVCSPATADMLRSLLARSGAPPERVVIELTETALLTDEAAAERFVRDVRGMGCRVALDDFGTGFSSLARLKCLPVDYLKIDKEFVTDLARNAASRRVVEAVAGLARGFGQRTVAEGVEDLAVVPILAELGVDRAQGYGLGRPGPLADVLALHARVS